MLVSFLPSLNLGAQISCPQNQYTDLKSALDQPLTLQKKKKQKKKKLCAQLLILSKDLNFQNQFITRISSLS